MYKLIIEDDEGKTTVVPLIRDEITIGRKEGNTIRLTERNVSRRHAKLVKSNGSVFIEDLTSYNGIKVNGDRIAGRAPVNEGDRVQIGDYQLALKLDKAQTAGGGNPAVTNTTAPAMPSAAPAAEMLEQKTTPFIKENGAAPAAMLDMAPTVQTPIQPTVQGPPPISGQSEAPARLVVVSSNFAGQEFVLDKAAVVIGRTDENDVVINHRSISRHHAKIVRETGHYHIVDLQSANGVRVNGEEYGKVELRKGDHVDLGHVRLRFVAPGEDFLFDRDAQVVDVSGAKKSRAGLVAVLMLVVVALAGGAFVLVKMTQKPSGGSGGTGDTPKVSGDVDGAVARLLLDADKAMKSEDWEAAIAKCDEALKLDPAQELARDKRQKAEAERKNRQAYNAFIKAAGENDYDSAVASFSEVAEDSVYRQKGSEKYAQVKKQYLRGHLEAAKRAKNGGKCEEARQHVEAALTVDEGNSEAQEILKSCGAVVKPIKVASPQEHKPHAEKNPSVAAVPAAKIKEKPTSEEPPSQPNPAAEKMLQDAQDAYVHGQYANAIETAKRASKSEPLKAWRIIGAASCFLKDRNGAMQAWNKLGPQERSFLKYVCSRNAITVP
ncbi:MAG TPA: FHA domain-containing protein [Polyangia bacterium]|jgi:pSer/pThr/pTyr-binding forkhead associated (FHA) protein